MTQITLPRETVQHISDAYELLYTDTDADKWDAKALQLFADSMDALRTALAAPAAQKVEQFDWTPVAAWWESGNEDFGNLKDAIRKMLAQQAAPAAREPVGWVTDDCGTVAWHKDVPPERTDLFICTQKDVV